MKVNIVKETFPLYLHIYNIYMYIYNVWEKNFPNTFHELAQKLCDNKQLQ